MISGLKRSKNLVNKITYNWPAKLISLISAISLFYYVRENRQVTRDLQVPVVRPSLPGYLVFSSKIPAYLNVQLSGPRELMDFPIADLKIRLANPKPKARTEPNLFRSVLTPELPSGVSARYKSGIKVLIDRVMIRRLPVVANHEFNLSQDIEAGYSWVTPSTIKIKGPREIVKVMDRIVTRKISVNEVESIKEIDPIEKEKNPVTPALFKKRVFVTGLPEFVELAPGQPLDVEYNAYLLKKLYKLPEGYKEISFNNINLRCSNNIRGFVPDVKEDIKITFRYPDLMRIPRATQFEAMVFCRLIFDKETKNPRNIYDVPIYFHDRLRRKKIVIVDISPKRITLSFKKGYSGKSIRIKGLEDHKRPKPENR